MKLAALLVAGVLLLGCSGESHEGVVIGYDHEPRREWWQPVLIGKVVMQQHHIDDEDWYLVYEDANDKRRKVKVTKTIHDSTRVGDYIRVN